MAAKLDLQTIKQKLVPWAKANANKLFLYGLGLLLLVRIFVYLSEAQSRVPATMDPPPHQLKEVITEDSDEVKAVQSLTHPLPEFEVSVYNYLHQINVFDPKLTRDSGQIEDLANNLASEATIAFQNGIYDQARVLVNEALKMVPDHVAARELAKKLDALEEAQAEPDEDEAQK